MKKLLLVGSDSVHTYNYLELISGYFDEVRLLTDPSAKGKTRNIETVDFSLRNPLNYFRAVRTVREKIKALHPELIHIHQANTAAYITLKAAKGTGIPVILTAWGSDVLLLPREGFLKRKMVGYVLQHADAFTSDSEYMAGEMRKMMRDDRKEILVANFGINVPVTGGEKENVIYSNRLHKKLYRIDKVIEGFHRFVKGGAVGDWKLVIAGSGEETGNLRGLVSGLDLDGQVLFAGWLGRDENAKYYARARVFVSIPESDATAISLLEAMASGCIPIVSDLPANREWVTDKMNGIVVRDLSENFFEGVLKMDREKIAVINRDIIAERGTKEGNRKKFIGLYERVLKNR